MAERSPSARPVVECPIDRLPTEQRRRRGSGRNSTQASVQVQAGPHLRCMPQAQTFCAAGCWQPQVQVGPGQVVQRQGFWFVSFMMSFLGVYRRRDVFDGWTFGAAALPRQSFETDCSRRCRNGRACRPNGCGALRPDRVIEAPLIHRRQFSTSRCREGVADRLPQSNRQQGSRSSTSTVRSRLRTLAGSISTADRNSLSSDSVTSESALQRRHVAFAGSEDCSCSKRTAKKFHRLVWHCDAATTTCAWFTTTRAEVDRLELPFGFLPAQFHFGRVAGHLRAVARAAAGQVEFPEKAGRSRTGRAHRGGDAGRGLQAGTALPGEAALRGANDRVRRGSSLFRAHVRSPSRGALPRASAAKRSSRTTEPRH